MEVRFGDKVMYTSHKCTVLTSPVKHIENCHATWEACPRHEWVHHFVHTLDMIPRNWYTSVEMQRGTLDWEDLATRFTHTFEFADDHPLINVALQVMKTKIFEEIHVATTNVHQSSVTIHHWMKCYNVMGEPDDDEPLDVNIPESEGICAMEGLGISSE